MSAWTGSCHCEVEARTTSHHKQHNRLRVSQGLACPSPPRPPRCNGRQPCSGCGLTLPLRKDVFPAEDVGDRGAERY